MHCSAVQCDTQIQLHKYKYKYATRPIRTEGIQCTAVQRINCIMCIAQCTTTCAHPHSRDTIYCNAVQGCYWRDTLVHLHNVYCKCCTTRAHPHRRDTMHCSAIQKYFTTQCTVLNTWLRWSTLWCPAVHRSSLQYAFECTIMHSNVL